MLNKSHLLQNGYKLILLFSLLAAVLILSGCGAQAAPKVYRVGILSGSDAFLLVGDGFKAKMTELGYIEGQNIVYDVQNINLDKAKMEQSLDKFIAAKVDLILVFPTNATLMAHKKTQDTNIPLVFAVTTLEGIDLVKSVREPGGNITGVRFPGPDVTVKRFEYLLDLAPQAKRIWLGYNPGYGTSDSTLELLRPAALAEGVTLVEVPVTTPQDVVADLEARTKSGEVDLDAILIMPDATLHVPEAWAAISRFGAEHNLPIAGSAAFTAEQGAVFSYIPDNFETGELAAPIADKILKGIPAGSIPLVTPESRLRLNYKLAQELGLTVPEGLLSQADEIIR
jgi:putative ABC transport system substrate-binding protein